MTSVGVLQALKSLLLSPVLNLFSLCCSPRRNVSRFCSHGHSYPLPAACALFPPLSSNPASFLPLTVKPGLIFLPPDGYTRIYTRFKSPFHPVCSHTGALVLPSRTISDMDVRTYNVRASTTCIENGWLMCLRLIYGGNMVRITKVPQLCRVLRDVESLKNVPWCHFIRMMQSHHPTSPLPPTYPNGPTFAAYI